MSADESPENTGDEEKDSLADKNHRNPLIVADHVTMISLLGNRLMLRQDTETTQYCYSEVCVFCRGVCGGVYGGVCRGVCRGVCWGVCRGVCGGVYGGVCRGVCRGVCCEFVCVCMRRGACFGCIKMFT